MRIESLQSTSSDFTNTQNVQVNCSISTLYQHYIVTTRVCVLLRWNLPGPDNYALQYADGVQTYITESVSHTLAQVGIGAGARQAGWDRPAGFDSSHTA